MKRFRPLIPLALVVLDGVAGCRPPGEGRVEKGPAAEHEPKAPVEPGKDAAPAAICASGEARCVSDTVASVCQDGARWVEAPCGEGSLCLGEGCVPLRVKEPSGERSLDPGSLLAPLGEGWIDAWSATGPLPGPLPDEAVTPPADVTPKPLCAKDGYVAIDEPTDKHRKGTRSPSHHLLSGYLVAGRKGPLVLAAGIAGRVRVAIDGERVLDETRDAAPAPFRDEIRVSREISRGVHRIVVEIEPNAHGKAGFWLRARTPDLLFASEPDAACAPLDLLRVEVEKKAVDKGFSVSARPAWIGLGPRQLADLPFHAELSSSKKATRPIGEGTLAAASIGKPEGVIKLAVPFEKVSTAELRVRLGASPGIVDETRLVYRGALHGRVVSLLDKRTRVEASSATRGEKDSVIAHIDDLAEGLAAGDPDISWLKRRTAEAEALVASIEKGESPYAGRYGLQRRAYRSPIDGRLQPYVLYVPRAYKPDAKKKKALPLVVAAHGLGNRPEIALRVVVGEAPESGYNGTLEARHMPGLPDLGAFIVAPNQFGNAGQRHLGEDDALRVIDEVRAHYPIDERRITVTGYSLGGTVAFYLPLHYPDLFAASAPLCGYPNLLGWESIRKAPHTPWEDVLLAKRYIVNWAENGLHVPLFMVHGGKDDPTRSRLVADRYRSLGYSYKFDVQEDLDHNVWDYAYEDGDMVGWLKSHRRPDVPSHVRFVSGEWRYDRAYWVRLLGPESEESFSSIDARMSKKDKSLTVETKNVESFALEVDKLGFEEAPSVSVDGKLLEGPLPAGTLFLVKKDGAFVRVESEPSRAGRKRAGVSGPLDDIDRHGFVVVYGTQDPAEIEANRITAEHFASFDTFAARFPVKSDVEITDAEIDARSLVLVGGPRSNRVTALFSGSLPARFEPSALTFREKRYEGADVGISFIHPHPKNPNEYIVVHAGVSAEGTLASRHLPRFAPDFLVYDRRITVQRGGRLLDRRAVLDGGFFDIDWK